MEDGRSSLPFATFTMSFALPNIYKSFRRTFKSHHQLHIEREKKTFATETNGNLRERKQNQKNNEQKYLKRKK